MSLFRKMFRDKSAPASQPRADFQDSDDESATHSRGAPRREVVHVVLRETMRLHGIPSDWIDARTLSLVSSNKSTGTHVTLVVHDGEEQLLPYVLAFQASFKEALERFDPRADDWLRGIAWQFNGPSVPSGKPMPLPGMWSAAAVPAGKNPAAMKPDAAPAQEQEDLERDLKALFAIRDAAMATRADPDRPDFQPTRTDLG